MTSATIEREVWQEQFGHLQAVLLSDIPLSEQLRMCAKQLRRGQASASIKKSPYLSRQIEEGISSLERASDGDYAGICQQFRSIVATPLEEADEEHLLVLVVKDVDSNKAPHPLLIHCTLDRRALEAQSVLRSREFINRLAERLGLKGYSEAALCSRVQGVNIINYAGYARYAVFADLVHQMDWTTSHTDGGLLFSIVADEFIKHDLPLAERMFPAEMERLRNLGVLNPETVNFLFNIFLALHDTLGHTVPYPVHHWVKRSIGSFMLDPFEELGADTQFFWMTSSERMRPLLEEVLSEAEIEALPILWLLKRVCHYTRRGIEHDSVYGNLMEDGDARTGVLFWQYFSKHGVFAREGDHFHLNRAQFASTVEGLLDDWLAVETTIPFGVEGYARALSDFYLKYRSSDDVTGRWIIPADLRASSSFA
ncbi:MAG TPA: hypothetical protein VJS44_19865 [Pyrinomonadaceae bacterium]|nr:hypothetical protein [Pyrinomonadaceae bacterium]